MRVDGPVYFDTSALAKWYLNEPHSEAVERFIVGSAPMVISDLTVAEMRSLLARKRREKAFDATTEAKVYAAFREDLRNGFLYKAPLSPDSFEGAVNLMTMLPDIPLRTLDALHLAFAQAAGATALATFDELMARAAEALELNVIDFG
ncbi:MAG TPA: type II toxin-antitoxin system VapC family toxin [Candidatus Deferrimicrobiaceae bacterium]|jgi:hypothetical protein